MEQNLKNLIADYEKCSKCKVELTDKNIFFHYSNGAVKKYGIKAGIKKMTDSIAYNSKSTQPQTPDLTYLFTDAGKTKPKKEFKTIATCIDSDTYNKVKEFAQKHNISIHKLLKTLINGIIK